MALFKLIRRRRSTILIALSAIFCIMLLSPMIYQHHPGFHSGPGGFTGVLGMHGLRPRSHGLPAEDDLPLGMDPNPNLMVRDIGVGLGLPSKVSGRGTGHGAKPLLTLFTTFRDAPDKLHIYANAIRNWAQFAPEVKAVLYTSSQQSAMAEMAKEHGWAVHTVPRVNAHGQPFMKDLFYDVTTRYDTKLHGFASGALLFADDMSHTVKFISSELPVLNSTLVIGRRTNYEFEDVGPIYTKEEVSTLGRTRGRLYRVDAEDYFIMSRGYPWHKVPDILVGRPGFDNFLVGLAVMNGMSVVDATNTILAVHQGQKQTQHTADRPNEEDSNYNREVIGDFKYNMGSTHMAQYETEADKDSNMFLRKRPKRTLS